MVAALNPLWAILDQQLGMGTAKRPLGAAPEATAQVIPLALPPEAGRFVDLPAAVDFPVTAAPTIPFAAPARPKITLTPVHRPAPAVPAAAEAPIPVVALDPAPEPIVEPLVEPFMEPFVEPVAETTAVSAAAAEPQVAESPATDAAEAKADWARVLDAILVARRKSQQQSRQLREQADAHRDAMHGLQKEIFQIRQQAQGPEDRVHQMQQEIHGRVREILKQTETRLQSIQAHADARVRAADERAEHAVKRAEAAEGYLRQLERAARSLTLIEESGAA